LTVGPRSPVGVCLGPGCFEGDAAQTHKLPEHLIARIVGLGADRVERALDIFKDG
jgi:hypothetical protein